MYRSVSLSVSLLVGRSLFQSIGRVSWCVCYSVQQWVGLAVGPFGGGSVWLSDWQWVRLALDGSVWRSYSSIITSPSIAKFLKQQKFERLDGF